MTPKIDLRTPNFDECFEKYIQAVFSQRVSLNVVVNRKRELPLDFDECFTLFGHLRYVSLLRSCCLAAQICHNFLVQTTKKGRDFCYLFL